MAEMMIGTERPCIYGIELRYLLTLHLLGAGPCNVSELVAAAERGGYEIDGRPSKVVSDALRWEVARQRVVRVGRGTYASGRVPRSTRDRMRRRMALRAAGRTWYGA